MKLPCNAPGCSSPRTRGFSPHCNYHKARLRRHGDVDQEGITKAALKPYAEIVRECIARNAENPLWRSLETRWAQLVANARGIVAAHRNGRPSNRYTVKAAWELARLGQAVEPREIVVAVAGMVLMRELDPRRFRSDPSFVAQVVRRVRGLTEANAVQYWDQSTGKTKRAYTDLGPRATAIMGQWLLEGVGIAGARIAQLEREARAARRRATRELHAGLESLS